MRSYFETMKMHHSFWNFSVSCISMSSCLFILFSVYNSCAYIYLCVCICIKFNFYVQIVPLLANQSPFQLSYLSFWYILVIFWVFFYTKDIPGTSYTFLVPVLHEISHFSKEHCFCLFVCLFTRELHLEIKI